MSDTELFRTPNIFANGWKNPNPVPERTDTGIPYEEYLAHELAVEARRKEVEAADAARTEAATAENLRRIGELAIEEAELAGRDYMSMGIYEELVWHRGDPELEDEPYPRSTWMRDQLTSLRTWTTFGPLREQRSWDRRELRAEREWARRETELNTDAATRLGLPALHSTVLQQEPQIREGDTGLVEVQPVAAAA
jgi:hypothetical protein